MSALKAACDELGGRIEIDTSLGIGTTVRFLFPLDFAKQPSILPPLRRASAFPGENEFAS
jgi:hypothetical protein